MKYLNLKALEDAQVSTDPFPHMFAEGVVANDFAGELDSDYPVIKKTGFFPVSMLNRKGSFDALVKELEGPEFSALMSDKLGVELRDKPKMITIRKWSAKTDGNIHNDGQAKIVTALLYLNDNWPENEDGGRFRILRDKESFDSSVAEVKPGFGNFASFVRTDNSWHGHKPFAGERKVVQITWLRSWEDYERKEKRGRFSYFLKKIFKKNSM